MGFTALNALSICVKFNIWGRVLHSAAYCNFTRLCNTRCCSCNHSVKRLVCPGKGMEGGGGFTRLGLFLPWSPSASTDECQGLISYKSG